MKDPSTKVISFPSPVPSKADYQRVKSSYSIKEIKQLFGLSEKTIRRWTEQGIIQAASVSPDLVYDFQALTQFRRVRELRAQGMTFKQIADTLHCCRTAAWRESNDIKNPNAKRRVKYDDEQIKQVRELRRTGYTLREVAERTGIPLHSLYHHCYDVRPAQTRPGQVAA